MAKKKTEKKTPTKVTDIKSMMGAIRKQTGSTSYDISPYGDVTGFIDTGCLSLNAKVSGSIKGGLPEGRIITITGESASGKSLIAAMTVANALNNQSYDRVFYLDSEGGGLKDFLISTGAPMDQIEHVLVDSVELATVTLIFIYEKIEEMLKSDPSLKFLVILDSFGALVSKKMLKDAMEHGEQKGDMGLTAKLKNAMMKKMMIPVLRSNASLIVLNHIYDDPAAKYPSKIKNMSGGHGIIFASHVIIQTAKKLIDDESNKEAHFNGNRMSFFTTKNRIVKPFHQTEMFIDFNTGMEKYEGLVDDAKKFGYITQAGAWYKVPSYTGDKSLRMSQILEDDKLWESFLDDLDKDINNSMRYGSKTEMGEVEKQELETLGNEDD
jgi:RecA/RadA recombinase